MAQKIQFNVGMDKTEFMTGSREIAQAISSLKGTVTSAGKVMRDSATGYGTAMRKSIAATREFETNIQGIKAKLDTLRGSISAIKDAANSFNRLKGDISTASEELKKMQDRMTDIKATNKGQPTSAWKQNTAEIKAAKDALDGYRSSLADAQAQKEEFIALGYNKSTVDAFDAQAIVPLQKLVESTTKKLEALRTQQELLKQSGASGLPKEYFELEQSAEQAKQRIEAMKKSLEEMRGKGYENADKSPEYTRQVLQVQKLEDALKKAEQIKEQVLKPPYLQAWESMTTLTGQISEGFGRLQYAAGMALTAIKNPGQTLDRLLGALTARVGSLLSSLARMAGSAALSFMKNLASSAANAAVQLAKIVSNAVLGGLSSLANAAKNAVINLGRLAMSAAASGLRSIANGAKTAATSLAKMTSSAIVGGIKRIASAAGAAGKGLAGMVRHNELADGSMKQSLKTVLKYAFGVRSMFFLFKRLRRAVSDAFTEMAKTTPEVRTALTGLQTALNGLKGSLATAFAPILTAIAPALIYLMNLLTQAMNTIGAFFAAFTGASVFKKAAGGISGTGKAAGGASKKVKELKRELAGFDELNILNGDKNNGGGGGGGGSGGGMKFTTENIPTEIKDFVDKVKELWNAGDFKGLGQFIAFKINYALMKARELISWENVEEKISAGVSAVAGIINGLTDPEKGINFTLLGDTFSRGIQTLINTIDLLVQKISFANIGVGIANFFNGILANEKLFEDIKKGFEDIVGALSDLSTAFLNTFKEGTLAERIRTTLGDTAMWERIGSEVWNVIKLAFNKTGNFLNVLLGGEDMQKDPNITRLMRKRPENITPEYQIDSTVWDSLKETLGNGISNALDSVTEYIESHNASEVISALLQWVVDLKNKAFGDGTGIGRLFGAVFSHMIDGWGVIIEAFSNDAETLGGQLAGAVNACIQKAFPEDGGTVAETFNNAVLGALDFVTAFLQNFDEGHVAEIVAGIADAGKWDKIANAAWEAMKLAFSKLGSFLDILFGGEGADYKLNDSAVDIDEAINEKFAIKNGGGTASAWGNLADSLANGFNIAIEKLTGFISNLPVTDAVGALADWIVRFKNGVSWDRVGGLFGVALGTALSAISEAVTTFAANAATDGANLAAAMNTLISTAFPDGESSLGTMFSNAVKSTFDFVTAFMAQFDEVTLAEKIRTEVDWDGIAEAAWNAFKTAVEKLGNFLTVLFGGEVDTGKAEDAVDAVERMWDRHDGSQNEEPSVGGQIGSTVSMLATELLDAIQWAISKISWVDVGDEIHNMLINIEWLDIAKKLWQAIVDAAKSFGDLLMAALFGKEETERLKAEREKAQEADNRRLQKQKETAQLDPGARAEVQMSDAQAKVIHDNVQSMIDEGQFYFDVEDFGEISPEAMQQAVNEFIEGWNNKYKDNPITFDDDDSGVFEFIKSWNEANPDAQMQALGKDVVSGVTTGVEESQAEYNTANENLIEGGIKAANDAADTGSPSKVYEALGEDIVAGLMLGLSNLPKALAEVWNALPEWARTLLGQSVSNLKIAMSGGGGNGGGGATGDVDDNTKIVKKETKEVKKLTKAVKNRGQDIVDVNYEGAGFDTSGDRPKLNVGVQFAPENEEPTDENTNGGLLGWLQTLLDPGVVVGVVALLTGKDPDSVTIGDIFDTILKVFGFLTGKDPNTLTLGDIFDTILNVIGFLTGKDPKSLALSKIFDTILDVIGFLTGKDPKSLKLTDIFDSILSILGFLTGKDPNSLKLSDIFDTILQVLAGKPILGAGVLATSLIDLFTGGKIVNATGAGLGVGVLASGLINLFTGGKTVKATGTERGGNVLQSALIDLFTGGKWISANGTKLNTGVLASGLIDLFTGGKWVTANGAKRNTDVLESGLIDLFTTGKWVKANGTKRNTGVSESGLIDLFTGGKPITAQKPHRAKGVGENGAIRLFTGGKPITAQKPTFAKGVGENSAINLFNKKLKVTVEPVKKKGAKVTYHTSVSGNEATVSGTGGVIANGLYTRFAHGNSIMRNGRASWWNAVNKYAAGTTRAHGTVFVAGEAGPEIMGHVNGRTEILNKSQLADAMYGAVVSGMANAVNALGTYLANHMTTCTNSIVQTIGANSITALAGMNYYQPAMANGGIMPYDVAMQIARSTQELQHTLDANNEDLIQALVSAMGNAANSIITAMQRNGYNNNVNQRAAYGNGIDAINRTTLMYGKSPLKGV